MAMTISGSNGVTYPDGTSQASGSQACKAWVNFNGTGTVAIRASYNVSSITDNGTGDYTVNFTTALADANYSVVGMVDRNRSTENGTTINVDSSTAPTAAAVRLVTFRVSVGLVDSTYANVAVFR